MMYKYIIQRVHHTALILLIAGSDGCRASSSARRSDLNRLQVTIRLVDHPVPPMSERIEQYRQAWISHNKTDAAALLQKCAGGNGAACNYLTNWQYNSVWEKRFPDLADLIKFACEYNHGPSCLTYADFQRDGTSPLEIDESEYRKISKKGLELSQQECDAGLDGGCLALSESYGDKDFKLPPGQEPPPGLNPKSLHPNFNRYVPYDIEKARHYAEVACSRGSVSNCGKLASLFQDPPADLAKLRHFDQRASQLENLHCKEGDSWACYSIGSGFELSEKYEEALPYYKSACKLENQAGCDGVKTIGEKLETSHPSRSPPKASEPN